MQLCSGDFIKTPGTVAQDWFDGHWSFRAMPAIDYTNFLIESYMRTRGLNPSTGNIFFVDSGSGNKGSTVGVHGKSPLSPFATIDDAFDTGNCVANNGDIVFVMPGHVETISAPGSLTMDVAGVSVIGLGQGNSRPKLNFTATDGTVEMDAADCRLSNVVISADIDAVAAGLKVDGARIEIDNCYFTFVDTGDDFILQIAVSNGGDEAYIHDNFFGTEIGADQPTAAIRLIATDKVRIEDNTFHGTWAGAIIAFATTLSTNVTIARNIGYNSDTSNYNGIDTGTLSSTGIVCDNRITALYDSAVAKIFRDGDLTSHNNTWANAVSERGVAVGTSST